MIDEHFPIAAAVAHLFESAQTHDRKAIIRADEFIDMTPSLMLRGISFLNDCLMAYKGTCHAGEDCKQHDSGSHCTVRRAA